MMVKNNKGERSSLRRVVEELQSSLEARELRLLERNKQKIAEQALLAQSSNKNFGGSNRGRRMVM